MNMKSSNDIEAIKNKFRSLLLEKNEEAVIEHDAYMLMAGYLSEIERIQQEEKVNRKDLAAAIKTSASYLTQVFRGDKPLNFYTLAKIQRALNIKFRVSAKSVNETSSYFLNGSISLPSTPDYLPNQENKNYVGAMHVVLGGRYNVPLETGSNLERTA